MFQTQPRVSNRGRRAALSAATTLMIGCQRFTGVPGFRSEISADDFGVNLKVIVLALLALLVFAGCVSKAVDGAPPSAIAIETVASSTSSWDGAAYAAYPSGQPEISVVKFTIAPHTTMQWHSHPMPNAGYVLSGELTIEKSDGTRKHFVAGEVIPETVSSGHRGISGAEPVVLIVFYAGTPALPLSQQPPVRQGK